jgi:hypothetical protein
VRIEAALFRAVQHCLAPRHLITLWNRPHPREAILTAIERQPQRPSVGSLPPRKPEMLCPPHPPAPVVENWLERHRHPVSFLLHMVGIPMTLIGALLVPVVLGLASIPILLFSVGLFTAGYLIQFLGHIVDRTEPGELTHIRRLIRHHLTRPGEPRSSPSSPASHP